MRSWFPPVVLLTWASLGLFGAFLPLHPNQVDLPSILSAPDAQAWFGHDDLGRPVWDRLVVGARTSFLVALFVVSISCLVGCLIGTTSGWFGGAYDHVVTRAIDIVLAFPGILLAIALAGILGPGVENVVIALACVGWVGFARLARAQTLSVRQREHVQAAVALGARVPRLLLRHVFPLIAAPIIVEATFGVAAVVIAEAGLSFLGLGVQPPQASWGSMVRDGTRYMLVAPHLVFAPGMALLLVVLSVNLLGDRMRDYLDVRNRPNG